MNISEINRAIKNFRRDFKVGKYYEPAFVKNLVGINLQHISEIFNTIFGSDVKIYCKIFGNEHYRFYFDIGEIYGPAGFGYFLNNYISDREFTTQIEELEYAKKIWFLSEHFSIMTVENNEPFIEMLMSLDVEKHELFNDIFNIFKGSDADLRESLDYMTFIHKYKTTFPDNLENIEAMYFYFPELNNLANENIDLEQYIKMLKKMTHNDFISYGSTICYYLDNDSKLTAIKSFIATLHKAPPGDIIISRSTLDALYEMPGFKEFIA